MLSDNSSVGEARRGVLKRRCSKEAWLERFLCIPYDVFEDDNDIMLMRVRGKE